MTRLALLLVVLLPALSYCQNCPQLRPGGVVQEPLSLTSAEGVLHVDFRFRTSVDSYGVRHYCYVYNGTTVSPTLRVHPGDELVLRLRNELPATGDLAAPADPLWPHAHNMEVQGICGGGELNASSTNLHFHGLHVPPTCHQDDVLSTLVEPGGGWYEYRIRIPQNQPRGLYWYHPHPHGFSERQVLGGASGALIVEDSGGNNPLGARAFERLLVLRDQVLPGGEDANEDAGPSRDLSVNLVPILYPMNKPARIVAEPGRHEFWRVLNASADTYFDLQLRAGPDVYETPYAVHFTIFARDGAFGPIDDVTHVLIPPGGRAEFTVAMPPSSVFAQIVTQRYDTGPAGESMPYRVLANIEWTGEPARPTWPAPISNLFSSLESLKPTRERKLYFSETHQDPGNYLSPATYMITVEGQEARPFDMQWKKPNIVARQGTVEDWTIENRAPEAHNFHIHQLHFQVLERDGKLVHQPGLRDTIDLPFWDGKGPYPSVTIRLDFRNRDILGTFLYHCHILEHEDGGMMGVIQVTR